MYSFFENFQWKVFVLLYYLIIAFSLVASFPNDFRYPKARIVTRYHQSYKPHLRSIGSFVVTDVPNSAIVLSEELKNGSVYLECIASFPIQWVYRGDGYPDPLTFTETRRTFIKYENPKTYSFYAEVSLIRIKEENTGKYICEKLGDSSVSVFFYLFVPGDRIFLQHLNPVESVDADAHEIHLPCRVTNPNVQVNVSKFSESNNVLELTTMTIDNSSVKWDPTLGFSVDISTFPLEQKKEFVCRAQNGNDSVREMRVQITYKNKAPEVRVTPNTSNVLNTEEQYFSCEANDPLEITFSGDMNETISMLDENVTDSQFLYKVSYIFKPESSKNHDSMWISCIDTNTRRTLHVWRLSSGFTEEQNTTNPTKAHFSYDPLIGTFSCCSSESRPKLQLVSHCSSPMECQMQQHYCLKTKRCLISHREGKTLLSDMHCVDIPHHTMHHNGMLICSNRQSSNEHFKDSEISIMYISSQNVNSKALSFISDAENIPLNMEILRVILLHQGPIYKDEEIEVTCEQNMFFLSKGYFWAFELKNGTLIPVSKSLDKDSMVPNLGMLPPTRRHTIIFPDVDIVRLYCIAPVWSSGKEWRNASIEVNILSPFDNT